MEDAPVTSHSAGQDEVTARVVAPATPTVRPDTLWRGGSPYLIPGGPGQRYTLGWHNTRKDGPCFVVARLGVIGDKVLDRFPLTADGWAQAWAALVKLDPNGAQAVAKKIQGRLTADAAHAAEMERQAQVHQAFASAGGATVFSMLGVQVPIGDGKVYTIGSYNPEAKTNASRLLGPLAGAQAMVTDGAQAWSPGRAMFLPISLAGLATKTKADAAVVVSIHPIHAG